MSLKSVKVKGFKTYREETTFGPFHEGFNSIVGINGSGKSTLFAALEFMLDPAKYNLSDEDRSKYLNSDDAKNRDLSTAHVEVVFDNTAPRRFESTLSDEFRLRRQWNSTKDEFFINDKNVSRKTVEERLSVAGLLHKHQHFIVMQGKVTELAQHTDEQRLQVLTGIAGATVYDDHRKEAKDNLSQAKDHILRVERSLDEHDKQLNDLKGETTQLEKFEEVDRKRRSLEYAVTHIRAQTALKKKNDALASVDEAIEDIRQMSDEIVQLQQEIGDLKATQKGNMGELESICNEITTVENTLDQRVATTAEAREVLKQAQKNALNRKDKTTLTNHRDSYRKQQVSLTGKIQAYDPEVQQAQEALDKVDEQLRDAQAKVQALENASDGSAKDQYEQSKRKYDEIQEKLSSDRKTLEKLKSEKEEKENEVAQVKEENEQSSAEAQELKKKEHSLTKEIDETQSNLSDINKSQNGVRSKLRQFEAEMHRMQRAPSTRNLPISAAQVLEEYVADNQLDGYYGPVLSLVRMSDVLYKPVERAVGNALFSVVVDSRLIAAKLIDVLTEAKAGRVTFIPLDTVKTKIASIPESFRGQDEKVKNLLDMVEFDARLRPAMEAVFGRTLLCFDAEIARSCRSSADCVTMDGVVYKKKGTLEGGYSADSQSKILNWLEFQRKRTQIKDLQDEMQKLSVQKIDLEDVKNKLIGEHSSVSSKLSNRAGALTIARQIKALEKEIDGIAKRIKSLESAIDGKTKKAAFYKTSYEQAKENIGENEEQIELQRVEMVETVSGLQSEYMEKQKLLQKSKSKAEKFEQELASVVEKITDIQTSLDKDSKAQDDIKIFEQDVQNCQENEDRIRSQLTSLRQQKDELAKDDDASKARDIEMQISRLKDDIDATRKRQSESETDEVQATKEHDMHKAHLDSMGAPPKETVEMFEQPLKTLNRRLAQAQRESEAFSGLNRKAVDQYRRLKQERDKFKGKLEEAHKSHEAIEKLISKLDREKDQKVQDFMNRVDRRFQEIMPRMIKGCRGELVLKTRGEETRKTWAGVSVKVQFPGSEEQMPLRSLSGGQATVVALGLIFAIQRCDPMPFYIFDEIDASLDTTFRASVAKLIHELSREATNETSAPPQFLCTTFREEQVQRADRWFVIRFRNGVSHVVNDATKQDALHIIKENAQSAVPQQGGKRKRQRLGAANVNAGSATPTHA